MFQMTGNCFALIVQNDPDLAAFTSKEVKKEQVFVRPRLNAVPHMSQT